MNWNEMLNAVDPISRILGEWSSRLDIYSILLRIALTVVFSAIIGWERSTKRHAAGLRTFMFLSNHRSKKEVSAETRIGSHKQIASINRV